MLQSRDSECSPGQSLPPSDGEGLLHCLWRLLTPPPQVLLHFVHCWFHSLQPPSTEIRQILTSGPSDKIGLQITSCHVFDQLRSPAELCSGSICLYPAPGSGPSHVSKHTGRLLLCNLKVLTLLEINTVTMGTLPSTNHHQPIHPHTVNRYNCKLTRLSKNSITAKVEAGHANDDVVSGRLIIFNN